jgi:DTW domain-containing protein YfiP
MVAFASQHQSDFREEAAAALTDADMNLSGIANNVEHRKFSIYAQCHRDIFDNFIASPGDRCSRCWMQQQYCFCEALPAVINVRHSFVLYISGKELSAHASSNTGKLLVMWGGTLICEGVPNDETKLEELLQDKSRRPVVLFPSRDATPASPTLTSNDINPLLIIALDGSWRHASRMNKRFPAHIPRVCLADISGIYNLRQSLGATRKWKGAGTCLQTAPALVHMLKECGEDTSAMECGIRQAVQAYAAQNYHHRQKFKHK